ncbi:MAG: carboxypeptidase-like regulatory domain-containing protein [Candidatus Bathyarchaeota archaeon]|nr:carboxypeptidase-like regulatory domain-containing protein [Candidatus Bathyarchaeota archaeon]
MKKGRLVTVVSVFLVLSLAQIVMIQDIASVVSGASTAPQLKLYAGPNSVLADNRGYSILAVQLQDSKGAPLRAQQDLEVRLSSSLTSVGTVDPTVIIHEGETCATAEFHATYTPGATTITAAASGYMTVQTTVTTIGPIPSKLAVYGLPPVLPANGNSYAAVIVQLQDSTGAPAKAPNEGVQVTLSSSNETTITVDSTLKIEAGKTYSTATVKTNAVGSAKVTATSSGYSSAQATITTQDMQEEALNLKVYLAPPKVTADGNTYQQVAVQLQDAKGKLATSSSDTTITLSSANTAVGAVEQTVTVSAGQTFALAEFTTTYQAGTTTITAAAPNCTTNQATLSSVGPVPSKLSVYCLPSAMPADGKACDAIQVQLQDSKGKPAKDPVGDILVYLSSSAPEVGSVNATLTIPFGETYAKGTFTATFASGSTAVTAQSSGYNAGQAKMTTFLIDTVFLNVSVVADSTIVNSGNQTTLRAYVTGNGTEPVGKATVSFETASKGCSLAKTTEEGNGYYTTVFNAPEVSRRTVVTVKVNATKTGYQSAADSIKLTVDLNLSAPKGTLQILVAEEDGVPVTDATITAQFQPAGTPTITGISNATGYATLTDIPEGTYAVEITKSGYSTTTITIQLTANKTTYQTMNLTKTDPGFFSLPVIVGLVVAVVVAVLVVLMIVRRRRSSTQKIGLNTQRKGRPKQTSPYF